MILLTNKEIKQGAKEGYALLKNIGKGIYFKKSESSNQVFIKDDYCRFAKKYDCLKDSDVWGTPASIKGNKLVFINFTY
jgi:hypothetical protein